MSSKCSNQLSRAGGRTPTPVCRVRRVTKMFGLHRSVRLASLLYALPGLAFGLGTVGTLAYLARKGELPMTPFGWRLMGAPLVGTVRFGALGWVLALALVATSALDVIAAIWLRQGKPQGARLGLATTPLTLMLAVAFLLPGLVVVAPVRALLVLAARRSLR